MRAAPIARPGRLGKVGWALAWCLAAASLIHPTATWLARSDWRADLLSHFREPAWVVSLLATAFMAPTRRLAALGLAGLALWQGWGLAQCSGPNPVTPDPRSRSRLRVVAANLLVDNPERAGLIALVRRERPDVLGLIEVSTGWLGDLEPIRAEFPHRFDFPADDDGRGLSLWFRRPPASVERLASLAPGGFPELHAVVDFADRPRHLWLVHLVSPLERPAGLAPGAELAALAGRVRRDGGSALVVGDCNTTDGSPHFARFLGASLLRDGRLGFGRPGSWPTWSPYRIGIDHTFVSGDLAVVSRRLGPPIGSDHFPVILEVAPAASPAAN